jgi:predicted heme/steroid binding protein/uncharacterized membrane protein
LSEERILSEEDLQAGDGQEDRPTYVAYEGKVYDLSTSKLWRKGTHVRRHHAGNDLTADLAAAPHGAEVFEREHIALIGRLAGAEQAEEEEVSTSLLDLYFDLHPHPVAVHFPVALVVVASVFILLNLLTRNATFETSAFYLLWAATIMTPLATLSGYISWWFNYGRILDSRFKAKIGQSATLFVIEIIALIIRSGNPQVLVNREPLGWVYAALFIVMAGLVAGLGWIGARIVFPPRTHKA